MLKENVYSNYEIAQLCEVAVILSNADTKSDDLEDFFVNHVEPLYLEWKNGMDTGIFNNEEEEGYISAYAERVAKEKYHFLRGGNEVG